MKQTLHFEKFERCHLKCGNRFFKLCPKSTQVRHFLSKTQSFLFYMRFGKFDDADFKYDNSLFFFKFQFKKPYLCIYFLFLPYKLKNAIICKYISDSNGIRTQNHLVRERTLNHLAKLPSLARWLSVGLRANWLWVRIPLLSLKLHILRLFRARSSLTFRQLYIVDSL